MEPVIRRTRSLPVTLVAVFEVFKAGFLLFLFEESLPLVLTLPGPGDVSAGQLIRAVFVLLFPVAAIYSLVLSWGIWRLQRWARRMLILAIVECWMLGTITWNGLFFSSSLFLDDLKWRALIGVLMLDLLIYGCLHWYPGVSEAFGGDDD